MHQAPLRSTSLSPIERAIVKAMISAIVKELRVEQSVPGRHPAA